MLCCQPVTRLRLVQMSDARVTFFAMAKLVNDLLFNPEQFLADMKRMAVGKPPPEADLEADARGLDDSDTAAPAYPPGADAGTSAPASLPPALCVPL